MNRRSPIFTRTINERYINGHSCAEIYKKGRVDIEWKGPRDAEMEPALNRDLSSIDIYNPHICHFPFTIKTFSYPGAFHIHIRCLYEYLNKSYLLTYIYISNFVGTYIFIYSNFVKIFFRLKRKNINIF